MADTVQEQHADGFEADAQTGQVVLWFQGRQYPLSGLEPDDFPAFRDRLKERMTDPMDALLPAIEAVEARKVQSEGASGLKAQFYERLQEKLLELAYRELKKDPKDRVPTREEVAAWIDHTEAGQVFSFWLLLKKKTPDITEQMAWDMLKAVGKTEFLKRRAEVSKRLIDAAKKAGS